MQPEKKTPGVDAPGFVAPSHSIGEIQRANYCAIAVQISTASVRMGQPTSQGVIACQNDGISSRPVPDGLSDLGGGAEWLS